MVLEYGYQLDEDSVRKLRETRKQAEELYRRRLEPEPEGKHRPDTSRHHMWVEATSLSLDGTANAYPAELRLYGVESETFTDSTVVWLRFANGGTPELSTFYWCPLEGFLDADGVAVYLFDDQGATSPACVYVPVDPTYTLTGEDAFEDTGSSITITAGTWLLTLNILGRLNADTIGAVMLAALYDDAASDDVLGSCVLLTNPSAGANNYVSTTHQVTYTVGETSKLKLLAAIGSGPTWTAAELMGNDWFVSGITGGEVSPYSSLSAVKVTE